jgi:hypothetical protein
VPGLIHFQGEGNNEKITGINSDTGLAGPRGFVNRSEGERIINLYVNRRRHKRGSAAVAKQRQALAQSRKVGQSQ